MAQDGTAMKKFARTVNDVTETSIYPNVYEVKYKMTVNGRAPQEYTRVTLASTEQQARRAVDSPRLVGYPEVKLLYTLDEVTE